MCAETGHVLLAFVVGGIVGAFLTLVGVVYAARKHPDAADAVLDKVAGQDESK